MKFREYKKDYLLTKMTQYEQVAMEINKVIKECKMEECEQGFELAKEMILNNEYLPTLIVLVSVLKEYIVGAGKWFATFITFILGVITALISENVDILMAPDFWKVVLTVFLFGFLFDVLIEIYNTKSEKLHIRILKDMKFDRYKFLLENHKQKIKK